MTPLAQSIVKELTLPTQRRTFRDPGGLLPRMVDIHCFEVSEIFGTARELARDMATTQRVPGEVLAFLPADKTWIEWRYPNGERVGLLLETRAGGEVADCTWAATEAGRLASNPKRGAILLDPKSWDGEHPAAFVDDGATIAQQRGWQLWLYAVIAMINTPRLIGRRQHMPHRGLERQLTKSMGAGKFPLHAWTEIKLEVSSPKDVSGEPVTEAHLTGSKALHFCRAHLRIRLGRLEMVRSHWRGDPALGIKQSRYRLAPPKRHQEAA